MSAKVEYHDYSSNAYWDKRYGEQEGPYDWYVGWDEAKQVLEKYVESEDQILIVGCGTSMFPAHMYDAGFTKLSCVDFSQKAIDFQEKTNSDRKIKFYCADVSVAKPKEYGGRDYDVVLDKGFLDCLLTGDPGYSRARKTIRRIRDAIVPTGVYISISNASQHAATRDHHLAVIARQDGRDWATNVRKATITRDVCTGDAPPTKPYYVYVLERAEGDEPVVDEVDDVEALCDEDDFYDDWEKKFSSVKAPHKWDDRGNPAILEETIGGINPSKARSADDDDDGDERRTRKAKDAKDDVKEESKEAASEGKSGTGTTFKVGARSSSSDSDRSSSSSSSG